MGVDEEADFDGGPAGLVAMGHFDGDAHSFLIVGNSVEGFLVAVEDVVDVVGAVDEEDGDAAVGEVVGGVVAGDPVGTVVAEFVDGGFLDGLALVEEAATVDGDGGFEAVVDGGDDAGGVAAPTDAGDGGAGGVDIGETANEGVGSDDVGDGVVGPIIGDGGGVDAREFFGVAVIGAAVGESGAGAVFAPGFGGFFAVGGVGVGGVFGLATGEVHGDGGVTAFGPEVGPFGEGGAAAAVDEDDGGEAACGGLGAVEGGGGGVEGEDFSGVVLVGFAGVEEGVDGVSLVEPAVGGGGVEFDEVPGDGGGGLEG